MLRWVTCNAKVRELSETPHDSPPFTLTFTSTLFTVNQDATVVWLPMGDNRAPILTYKIQYNTSFTPDTWETATGYDTDKNRFTGLKRKKYRSKNSPG